MEYSSKPFSFVKGEFIGTFTAVQSVYQFSYDYTGTGVTGTLQVYEDFGAGLKVNFHSSGFNAYTDPSGSDIFTVNVPVGHTITVAFKTDLVSMGTEDKNLFVNYYSSVVPEPISSTLFIVGGALLASPRYTKRRKKA